MPAWPLVALAAALLIAAIRPAEARPLEAELPSGKKACWERVYDDAHLVAHPKQKVTRIQLMHLGDVWGDRGADGFYLSLQINLRERPKRNVVDGYDYSHGAMCKPAGAGLVCRNGWDAGTFRIERSGAALLVRNGGLIANPANYDSEDISDDAVKVPAKPDDGAWKLERVSNDRCVL